MHVFCDVVFAWIPCASHVPPRCIVETKNRKEMPAGFLAAIPAPCRKMPPRATNVPTYGQLGFPKSRLKRPKSRKKRAKGTTNAARREKCAQAALKSEKCANIEPT